MRMNKSQVNVAREMFESLAYEAELDCSVRKARKILAACGCTVKKDGPFVTLFSPTTGGHTLNMARGVRPVSDLMAHVTGFAENQAGVPDQIIQPWQYGFETAVSGYGSSSRR